MPFEWATEIAITKSNLNVKLLSAKFVADMERFKAMSSGEDWENGEVIRQRRDNSQVILSNHPLPLWIVGLYLQIVSLVWETRGSSRAVAPQPSNQIRTGPAAPMVLLTNYINSTSTNISTEPHPLI